MTQLFAFPAARRALALAACLTVGGLFGLGLFTFSYGEGASYFSTDPRACVNCHIMQSQYDDWQKASHHTVAGCVDCHLPHTFIDKYLAKADNGFRHSWAFTFENFHEPIQMHPRSTRILQDNCLYCHAEIASQMATAPHTGEEMSCVRCHVSVGHGPRR